MPKTQIFDASTQRFVDASIVDANTENETISNKQTETKTDKQTKAKVAACKPVNVFQDIMAKEINPDVYDERTSTSESTEPTSSTTDTSQTIHEHFACHHSAEAHNRHSKFICSALNPTHCFNCDSTLGSITIPIPDVDNTVHTITGTHTCCSIGCALRYLEDHPSYNTETQRNWVVDYGIKVLGFELDSKAMKIAPPRSSLIRYGGFLSLDQYTKESWHGAHPIELVETHPLFCTSRPIIFEAVDIANRTIIRNFERALKRPPARVRHELGLPDDEELEDEDDGILNTLHNSTSKKVQKDNQKDHVKTHVDEKGQTDDGKISKDQKDVVKTQVDETIEKKTFEKETFEKDKIDLELHKSGHINLENNESVDDDSEDDWGYYVGEWKSGMKRHYEQYENPSPELESEKIRSESKYKSNPEFEPEFEPESQQQAKIEFEPESKSEQKPPTPELKISIQTNDKTQKIQKTRRSSQTAETADFLSHAASTFKGRKSFVLNALQNAIHDQNISHDDQHDQQNGQQQTNGQNRRRSPRLQEMQNKI